MPALGAEVKIPLVSILIPCYNAGLYLAAALDSALAQTWPNKEIIVVNDGSTDRSGEIIDSYRGKGIKVIHQENKGQCAAANRAFQECSGDYIKFFDADDLLAPRTVELQRRSLRASGDGFTAMTFPHLSSSRSRSGRTWIRSSG
jgi:glycosyltransferase involved in cell wall biosynthesis